MILDFSLLNFPQKHFTKAVLLKFLNKIKNRLQKTYKSKSWNTHDSSESKWNAMREYWKMCIKWIYKTIFPTFVEEFIKKIWIKPIFCCWQDKFSIIWFAAFSVTSSAFWSTSKYKKACYIKASNQNKDNLFIFCNFMYTKVLTYVQFIPEDSLTFLVINLSSFRGPLKDYLILLETW